MRITAAPGSSFLDRMIALVEGAERQKTPNELALSVLLVGMTLIFLIAVVSLAGLGRYSAADVPVPILVALLVTLIPTTIGGLLSAIGIAGMDRLIRHNVLAMSGRAVEAAGDVDTLLLDKTGTITFGNRMASEIIPVPGITEHEAALIAVQASLADETAEGRSILELARDKFGITPEKAALEGATPVPFSASTRLSGVDAAGRRIRKGAVDAIKRFVHSVDPHASTTILAFEAAVERIARSGGTPLGLAENGRLLGVIHLKDVVKPDIKDRFAELRRMGIRTVMVTGDNPVTAAAIASEAGVDDFIAEATPQDKLAYIRTEQRHGRLVAMCGDGTNDAPALAQADVGVAMQSGTQAAREAGNMVDLDSDPTKLIEIVGIGKQLLDDARRADHLLDRQRRGEVLRHHPGAVHRRHPRARPAQRHGAVDTAERHPVGGHLQRADHHRADPAGAARREVPRAGGRRGARPQPARLRSGGIVLPFIGIKLIDIAITAMGLA